MKYKPIKSSIDNDRITVIVPELGYKLIYKINYETLVDAFTEYEGDNYPDFMFNGNFNFEKLEPLDDFKNRKETASLLKHRNLLSPTYEYDHIQVGFIYADGDPNNHKWMLNFMDVNNKYLFGYIGDSVDLEGPFTTTSWEDGNWHGRFVVYKKDVDTLTEPEAGKYILKAKGDIGQQNLTPLDPKVKTLSLRYNVHSNMWYCDLYNKKEKIGEYPCKNIICDVPFKGKIDRSTTKPKVTANIDANNVAGISMALNALIIKKK